MLCAATQGLPPAEYISQGPAVTRVISRREVSRDAIWIRFLADKTSALRA